MKVTVHGAAGRMGKVLLGLIEQKKYNSELACAVDKYGSAPCLTSLSAFSGETDVIVDFSNHTATAELLEYAKHHRIPVVVCTTGHTCDELELIRQASEFIPVFHSGNMSVGIAVLIDLASRTAAAFPDANIEIVETHHNRKLDAPSGTALMIADSLRNVRPDAYNNCGRHGNCPRNEKEIGISSLRYGNIVGIHEVIISTDSQTLTRKHAAHDRALFAEGALAAADFIKDMPAGLYCMDDLLKSTATK